MPRTKTPQPTRILFIGNSFTNRNDLPGLITGLAASASPPRVIQTERVIANGMALKTHWERGDARQAIQCDSWDYVVLQEQSTLPLKNRQKMHESIRLFNAEIRAHGAKTVLYLTWARQNAQERQDELADAYLSIGKELGALVCPVGVAWQQVWKRHPEVMLYDKDGSHPSLLGSYLAACVFVAVLLDLDPRKLEANVFIPDKQVGRTLQEQAWKAATARRY